MSTLLLLSSTRGSSRDVVPSLDLLSHRVRILPPTGSALVGAPACDVVLVDGCEDLAHARDLCRLIRATGSQEPLVLVVTEGGLPAVAAEWGADEVLLAGAGPAEVDARIRLVLERRELAQAGEEPPVIRSGAVEIDEASYTARLGERVLDLTFKEFELLKYLAQHPGRVFTREQLVQEVWGYDYFGGTRTVDVHVRRLRAKLGADHESLIGTVRNVGYRLVPASETVPDTEGSTR